MVEIEPVYYTVRQVAELFKVHEQTIYRLIKRGKIAAVEVGGAVRIPESSLKEMIVPVKPHEKEVKKDGTE